MRVVLSVIFALLSLSACSSTAQDASLKPAKKVVQLMGCRFELTAIAVSDTMAWKAVETGIQEIERIEKVISSWDKNSQTSQINRQAGIQPVKVDKELFDLIFRAKKVAKLTGGAFDISFASIDWIWKFDGTEQVLPSAEKIAKSVAKINWEHIILDKENSTVFLKEKGMKIGFGGIGKGYAANKAKQLMQNMTGVKGGVVNASGDLIAWGQQLDGDHWKIQIANPENKTKSLGWLSLKDMAVVTSGDYEKFFKHNGKRYAHIVNPKTGYPTTGITSVTVVCPDAELADALATSVFVLGTKEGLELINQLQQIECFIITDEGEMLTSNNLQLNRQ